MPKANDRHVQKVFSLAAPSLSENTIAGAANVVGILDQADDVIFPGFYEPVLADFLANGFVPVGHDWEGLPVAYPTVAEMRGNKLYSEAIFHSTSAAQDARTVAYERIEAGKSVGLSVGFLCASDGIQWFKDGPALLSYAEKKGYDLGLFDVEGITAFNSPCRALTRCEKLYEWSIVSAPCNTQSVAGSVKGGTGSMPKGKSLLGLSLRRAATGQTLLKGEFLGNVEQDAAMSSLRTINSALMSYIFRTLYLVSEDVETVDDLVASIPDAFDEARDLSVETLRSLLADVDLDDLREDIDDWYYYYYSASPGEQATLTLTEESKRLATDVAKLVNATSRRQAVRMKAGRKLSADTTATLQEVYDGLTAHCSTLKDLLGMTDSEDDPDADANPNQMASAPHASNTEKSASEKEALRLADALFEKLRSARIGQEGSH